MSKITTVEYYPVPTPHILRVVRADGSVEFEYPRSSLQAGMRAAELGFDGIRPRSFAKAFTPQPEKKK